MRINFNLKIQTHLFTGSCDILIKTTIALLQNILCANNSCNKCFTCNQILRKNHEQILWLKPEKQYNLEQIDIIIKNISFNLDQDKKYFVIFEQADLLTVACSNRLLKSIEEPPDRYYFIFLTQRPKSILPTITSRCVVSSFEISNLDNIKENLELSDIGKFFLSINSDPIEFLKIIDKNGINEYESYELVDKLISYWSIKCKTALTNQNQYEFQKTQKIIDLFCQSLQTPPMSGSSKIFWKNLYLNFLQQNQKT